MPSFRGSNPADPLLCKRTAGGTGQGADRSIVDPALKKVSLLAQERAQLLAFVRALTAPDAVPAKPVLP